MNAVRPNEHFPFKELPQRKTEQQHNYVYMYVVFSAAEGRRIDKVLTEQQHEHLELILVLI